MSSDDRFAPAGARPDLDDLPERPLTVPLLIRGSFDNGVFVACCAVAIFAGGIGVLLWRDLEPAGASLAFAVTAVAAVMAVVLGAWLGRQREWLEVTLTGFVLSRRGQRRV